MVKVEQNLGYCIALSAAGGILEVFATAALAYPDAKKKQGNQWSPYLLKVCLLINVVLQILASVVGNLVAPWFGPISIVGPTFLSAQLVANMIIYGSVLGLESFTKDMRIGTSIIVTAAALLPVVGPGVQDGQDASALMDKWYAHAWNAALIVGMVVTAILLTLRYLGKFDALKSTTAKYAVLLTARATSFAVNLSYSKVFALGPTLPWLVTSIILKVLSGAVMTGSIIVQSTAVSQNTFVPLNATTVILVNALTGIVIWEDWRAVSSWLGYATVFIQLIVGNYLLLGEIDLFGPSNRRYGRRLLFRRMAGRNDLHVSSSDFGGENIAEFDEESGEDENLVAGETQMDGDAKDTNADADTEKTWSNEGSSSSRSDFSDKMAAAWMAASSGDITEPGEEAKGVRQDVNSSEGAAANAATSGPSLARPPSLGQSSQRRQLSTGYRPRPSPIARRCVTTGSAGAGGFRPASSLARPSAVVASNQRSQSTGVIHSPGGAAAERRRHFFGRGVHDTAATAVRREAWGQVFGVDRSWLEQRAAHRMMEAIIEVESGDSESVM